VLVVTVRHHLPEGVSVQSTYRTIILKVKRDAVDGSISSSTASSCFSDGEPSVDSRVTRRAGERGWRSRTDKSAGTTQFLKCGIDGCKRIFESQRSLTLHQEGASHLAIPYYCPLTSEHCPRAPCPRAQGGSGDRLVGRWSLKGHLQEYHAGHTGVAAGLDLSWDGLVAFRDDELRRLRLGFQER